MLNLFGMRTKYCNLNVDSVLTTILVITTILGIQPTMSSLSTYLLVTPHIFWLDIALSKVIQPALLNAMFEIETD